MIYTLTLAPALDLNIEIDKIKLGQVNRTNREFYLPGGKGISVANMLKTLSKPAVCLGFLGGYSGKQLRWQLNQANIKNDFVRTKSPTRVNVVLTSKEETNFNSPTNPITKEEYNKLIKKLLKIKKGDILVIAGSIPKDLDMELSKKVLNTLYLKGVKFVFDLSSKYLLKVGKYKPILVKPNRFELADIFDKKIKNDKDIITLAKKLVATGCENVIVSCDKNGAILVNNTVTIKKPSAIGTVVSAVGAGDSMVAGFITSYLKTKDYNKMLVDAIIAGSATAFSNGIANKEMVENVKNQLYKLHKIK